MSNFIEAKNALYLKKDEKGNIVLANQDGEIIDGQVSVSITNSVDDLTMATVMLTVAGWAGDE